MAGHRLPATDRYSHPELSEVLGAQAANAFLRDQHYQIFLDWLSLTIEEKVDDLMRISPDAPSHRRKIVRESLLGACDILPPDASLEERDLYLVDLEAADELSSNYPPPSVFERLPAASLTPITGY